MRNIQRYIENFLKYRFLLKELVSRDIKIKYRRSVLGILWSLLNPLMMMIVLSIVFSALFKHAIPNFPVYLLSGRLIYDFFSQGTRAAMVSIRSSASLLKKVYIPKYMFPLSKVLSTFVTFLISMIVLLIVMLVTRVDFTLNIIFAILPLFYILLFTIGCGLIISTLAVFFRDVEHLYDVILLAWMYFTPLFYPAEIVPRKYQFLLKINPLYYIITIFREAILYGKMPSLGYNIICLSFSLLTFLLGLIVFYRKQDKFILYI